MIGGGMQQGGQNEEGVFCATCVAESTEETPGNVSTVNGIGRTFYGKAEPCATCGSVVRTLWWTLISVPVIPRGSYRYLAHPKLGSARFWARRTHIHWGQIWKTWLVGIVLGALASYLIINYGHRLFGK
jgi:hypothetical protein